MTDFLNKILAGLFEKFKQSSPLLATLMLLFLGTINYTVTSAGTLGLELPEWILKAVEWISYILLALTGSKTYKYLNPTEDIEHEEVK